MWHTKPKLCNQICVSYWIISTCTPILICFIRLHFVSTLKLIHCVPKYHCIKFGLALFHSLFFTQFFFEDLGNLKDLSETNMKLKRLIWNLRNINDQSETNSKLKWLIWNRKNLKDLSETNVKLKGPKEVFGLIFTVKSCTCCSI